MDKFMIKNPAKTGPLLNSLQTAPNDSSSQKNINEWDSYLQANQTFNSHDVLQNEHQKGLNKSSANSKIGWRVSDGKKVYQTYRNGQLVRANGYQAFQLHKGDNKKDSSSSSSSPKKKKRDKENGDESKVDEAPSTSNKNNKITKRNSNQTSSTVSPTYFKKTRIWLFRLLSLSLSSTTRGNRLKFSKTDSNFIIVTPPLYA